MLVGDGQGTSNGGKAQFSQPTGICFDKKTLFTVDTSTGELQMTSSVSSLMEYLKYLHLFGETFGLSKGSSSRYWDNASNRETRVGLSIWPRVCRQCQDCNWHARWNTGPSRTCFFSSNSRQRRLFKSLCEMKVLLDRISSGARFNIKSILTLVVENTFSEMRTGASDMPLQLEFDYRFSRSIKESLKRQCSAPYSYFTSSSSYYPHTFVSANYSDLPKLRPPKTN